MGTLGPNSGGTFASDNTLGIVAITNPTNALISDNSYATSVLLLGQTTQLLKATNFGFSIPLDATILGVLVEVERSSTVLSAVRDNSIRLVKAGTISGDEKASATLWPTSDAYASYGSASDLWGLSLTPQNVNASDFGVVIGAIADVAATAQIDHIRITITYMGSNKISTRRKYFRGGNGLSVSEGTN